MQIANITKNKPQWRLREHRSRDGVDKVKGWRIAREEIRHLHLRCLRRQTRNHKASRSQDGSPQLILVIRSSGIGVLPGG